MSASHESRVSDDEDNDRYFVKRELIPGFPYQEFESVTSQREYWNDSNIRMVEGKLFRSTSQKTCKLLRSLPFEIQEGIFNQIVDHHVPGPEADYSGMSPNLALDWVQDPEADNRIELDLQVDGLHSSVKCYYSPVKYSLRTSNPAPSHWPLDIRKDMKNKYLCRNWPTKLGPGMNFHALKIKVEPHTYLSPGLSSWKTINIWQGDVDKEALGLSKSVENDYVLVRSYDDLLEFAKAIAHSEDFVLQYNNNNGLCIPVWKSNEKYTGILKNFLSWFWREFELDFTCEFKICNEWLRMNFHQFLLVQNINIDIDLEAIKVKRDYQRSFNDFDYFEEFCRHLKQLSNLMSLTVCLKTSRRGVLSIIHNPGAFTWISALKCLPVLNKFRLLYLPTGGDYENEPNPWDPLRDQFMYQQHHAETDFRVEKKLRERLMPATLSQEKTYDLPDDLGLAR